MSVVPRTGSRRSSSGPFAYATLVGVGVASVFPLYWSLVVSSRDGSAIAEGTPVLIPGGHLLDNIRRVFDTVDFWFALQNSLIVAGTLTVSTVFLSTLAGFAFAHLRFPGRNALFLVVVGSVMLPAQVGVIPMSILMGELGWHGRLVAVIVPGLVNAFSVFWMRQACEEAVPEELISAARVDGCSHLATYWYVVLPALRPQAVVLAMLTFMAAWNDFFWPLVVLDPNDAPTVQVALSRLASGYYTDYALMLTGASLATLPVIVIFLLLARRAVTGIVRTVPRG